MKRIIAAAVFLMVPGAVFGQEEKVLTPREAEAAVLADLRGRQHALDADTDATFALRGAPTRPAEPVSVPSLRHRVPKAARRAFERGEKFAQKGDSLAAIAEFERAVSLDPEYAAAHVNLALDYMGVGRPEDAEKEVRRALELDPYLAPAHLNLGWILFRHQNLVEAEQSVRRALALSPGNARAHLLLGVLLGANPATRGEGIGHLEQAVRIMENLKNSGTLPWQPMQ